MENKDVTPVAEENSAVEDKVNLENTAENQNGTEGETSENSNEGEAPVAPVENTEGAEAVTEFAKENKEEDKDADKKSNSDEKKEEDDKEDKKKYELLEQQYNELNEKYTVMEKDYQTLKAFKADIEDKEKDALIGRFCMLSDEDKKDVIANKSNYSLDDIEAKLSIIYTKKKLAAEQSQTETSSENAEVLTYSLADNAAGVPDWIKAVREVEENLKF